jgi:5-methylcytosine-specific restriction enzyme subunit McrC
LCVIDTKYKKPDRPSAADVQEVVTYAEAKGCTEAVLVYPVAIPRAALLTVGRKSVRSLTFALDRNLEESGHSFKTRLLEAVG